MVSKEPPRRAKSEGEPLTIDLETNATAPAETSDTPVTADAAATIEQNGPTGEPVVGQTVPEQTAREPAAAEHAHAGPSSPNESTRSPEPAKPSAPSAAGALAAAIVGGLVALAGAGALQYAGILPQLGPDRGAAALEQALAADVEALKTQVAGLSAPIDIPDIAPLEERVAALETKSTQTAAALPEVAGLEARITELQQSLDGVRSGLATVEQTTETAKTELSTRIDAAEEKLSDPSQDIRLAQAIALTAVKTAIDRGGPFLAELDALKSVAPDAPAVAGLAEAAATGVVSRADLARTFPDTADLMVDAVRERSPDQGIFDRLVNSAASAIRVRPVGSIEGDGPDAIIARIENKIDNGDLKGAVLEWDGLPEAAKTAGNAYRLELDRRIAAEDLIDAAIAGALAPTPDQG